jgi:ABC-type multidrug transport system ATPase subunit
MRNVAGKTTTLRMLTTLLEPTAGTAVVAGAELYRLDRAEARRRCAVLLAQLDLAGLQGR